MNIEQFVGVARLSSRQGFMGNCSYFEIYLILDMKPMQLE